MMRFVNPLLLWSLAGLVIPLGIHLLSRKEGKVLRLGSLRHVQETSTQQFKGIRLNEIVLLMLRCAMIILLSLLGVACKLSKLEICYGLLSKRDWNLIHKLS